MNPMFSPSGDFNEIVGMCIDVQRLAGFGAEPALGEGNYMEA